MSNWFPATVYLSVYISKHCVIKQLLDLVFVRSGIIKVLPKCHQLWPSARLITLTSTLIVPDITKTSFKNNYCLEFCNWYGVFHVNRDFSNKERCLPKENWGMVAPFCQTKKQKDKNSSCGSNIKL